MRRVGSIWVWSHRSTKLVRAKMAKTLAGSFVVYEHEEGEPLHELAEGQFASVFRRGQPMALSETSTLLRAVGASRYTQGERSESERLLGRCCYAGGLLKAGYLCPALVVVADGPRVGLLARTKRSSIIERRVETVCPTWWTGMYPSFSAWLWAGTAKWNPNREPNT